MLGNSFRARSGRPCRAEASAYVQRPRVILRLLRGSLSPADTPRFTSLLREAVRPAAAAVDGLASFGTGTRDDGDTLTFAAFSTWRDMTAIDNSMQGRSGPTRTFLSLEGLVDFEEPEHFELAEELAGSDATRAVTPAGAIGIVRAVFRPGAEGQGLDMVRRQQHQLIASGDVGSLLIGRRVHGPSLEIVAVAMWLDRDRMQTFLVERPEGPGLDPRFVDLATDLRFETFDVLDLAAPIVRVGEPAVLVLDADRVVVDASPAVERQLGRPAELLLGRRLDDMVADDERPGLAGRWAALLRDGRDDAVVAMRGPDGTVQRFRHHAIANVPAPGLQAILIVAADASETTDVEAAVRRALGGWRIPRFDQSVDGNTEAIRLVTLPGSDRLFHRFVGLSLDALGVPSIRRLQLHLRGIFPRAVVHRRELTGESGQTWYVFRDGRVRRSRLPEGWWGRSGVASGLADAHGRLVEVDEASGALYGLEPAELRERNVRTLGVPGSQDDLALLLRIAFEERAVDSTVRLLGATGEPLDVAIHAEREGDLLHYRVAPVPPDDAAADWFAPICLPSWDAAFIGRVEDLCERLAPRDAATFAEELGVRLRVVYPRAVVRPLGRLLGFGPHTEVLLVYRDGEQSPYAEVPWWDDPDVARLTLVGDRYVEANEAAAGLHGVTREQLLASRLGRFRMPSGDGAWLSAILQRTGMLHTTTTLRLRDGEPVEIEYRAVVSPANPRRVEVAMRPTATASGAPATDFLGASEPGARPA
jgi:PAS domain-containing protein